MKKLIVLVALLLSGTANAIPCVLDDHKKFEFELDWALGIYCQPGSYGCKTIKEVTWPQEVYSNSETYTVFSGVVPDIRSWMHIVWYHTTDNDPLSHGWMIQVKGYENIIYPFTCRGFIE